MSFVNVALELPQPKLVITDLCVATYANAWVSKRRRRDSFFRETKGTMKSHLTRYLSPFSRAYNCIPPSSSANIISMKCPSLWSCLVFTDSWCCLFLVFCQSLCQNKACLKGKTVDLYIGDAEPLLLWCTAHLSSSRLSGVGLFFSLLGSVWMLWPTSTWATIEHCWSWNLKSEGSSGCNYTLLLLPSTETALQISHVTKVFSSSEEFYICCLLSLV